MLFAGKQQKQFWGMRKASDFALETRLLPLSVSQFAIAQSTLDLYFALPGEEQLQMTYDKRNYRQYWKDRACELQTINHAIWGFTGAAALIEHGTKLANAGEGGAKNYKDFVKTFGDSYVNFAYQSGDKDLDVQIYHTFRCGLLHSFSLVADDKGEKKGARDSSIVLCSSRKDAGVTDSLNCTPYTAYDHDACRLVLEPFVADIGQAIDKLFDNADLDESIKENWKTNPPFNAFA